LDDSILVTTDAEMDGVRLSLDREMPALRGISEVAALAELSVRRSELMSRRGTPAGESIPQRQPSTMRPKFGIVTDDRKEIRAGHRILGVTLSGILPAAVK